MKTNVNQTLGDQSWQNRKYHFRIENNINIRINLTSTRLNLTRETEVSERVPETSDISALDSATRNIKVRARSQNKLQTSRPQKDSVDSLNFRLTPGVTCLPCIMGDPIRASSFSSKSKDTKLILP